MKREGFNYNLEMAKKRLAYQHVFDWNMWRMVIFVVVLLLIMLLLNAKNNWLMTSLTSDVIVSKQVEADQPLDRLWQPEYRLLSSEFDFAQLDHNIPQLWDGVIALDNFNEIKNGWLEGNNEKGIVFLPKMFDEGIQLTREQTSLLIEPMGFDPEKISPVIQSDMLVYDEIYPNTMFIRQLRTGEVKDFIVLKNGYDLAKIYWRINFQGGNLIQNQRQRVEFFTDDGRQVFEIENLKVIDEKGNIVGGVEYELVKDDLLEMKFNLPNNIEFPLLVEAGAVIY